MLGFFSWLRSRVSAAVLAGLHDAIAAANLNDGDLDTAAAALRARIEALPAPEEKTNGHAEPVVASRGRKRE